ncbi:hypothetical protein AURDEDRAFT_71347 [Auricularia subglabra TFB-10046 SS5]|nr:hypothetical protein AURDEDRAFT_71347 [Auricularia subglabra TFB-10046 SS5]
MCAVRPHVKPEIQQKFRDEGPEVGTDAPLLDMLNSLPDLYKVTREILRFHTVPGFLIGKPA